MRTHTRPGLRQLRTCLLSLILAGGMIVVVPARADVARRGETKLVSQDANGLPADGGYSDVSDDGRYVVFESWDRLVPQDTEDLSDVYVKDMLTGSITLVSTDVPGVSDGLCNHHPSMSADGSKIIFFSSFSSSPLKVHINRCLGVLVVFRDLTTGASKRLSLGASGFYPENARLSGDGKWIVVHKDDDYSDDYISIISVSTGEIAWTSPAICWGCIIGEPSLSISNTGRFITFRSQRDLVPGDTDADWDIYFHDRDTDQDGVFDEPGATNTRLASIRPNGVSRYSADGSVSDSGRYVAFLSSWGNNCIGCSEEEAYTGLYVRDLVANSSEFIAFVYPTAAAQLIPLISADGRLLVFESFFPHTASDTDSSEDIYMFDRQTKEFTLASPIADPVQEPIHITDPAMSSDGRFVTFNTDLVALVDLTDVMRSVYIRDMFAPCLTICAEDQIPDPDPIIEPVIDAGVGAFDEAMGTLQAQLAGKIFPPYDASRVCAVWSTPRANSSTPVRTDATNYCWYNDSGNSRGYDISSAPIYGLLQVGGWDYLWAPPVIDGYAASLYHAELVEKSLPSSGTLTVTAHMTGAVTAVPSQFVDRFKGCLRLINANSGSTIKVSCFNKTDGVQDLTVTAAVAGPVWAVVAIDMTGDVGQATVVVNHLSFSVS